MVIDIVIAAKYAANYAAHLAASTFDGLLALGLENLLAAIDAGR